MEKLNKYVSLVMIILLICGNIATANAQSIKDVYEEANNGWHKEYTTPNGIVNINIPVQVPNVEKFPFIEGTHMPISSELPETFGEDYANMETELVFNHARFFRVDVNSTWVAKPKSYPDPGFTGDTPTITMHINQLDPNTPYAWNNPATIAQGEALLKDVWARYFPNEAPLELIPDYIEAYGPYRRIDKATGEYYGEPWAEFEPPLIANYNQLIHGIPLIAYVNKSYTKFGEVFPRESFGGLSLTAIMQNQKYLDLEPFTSAQYNAFKETSVLKEDLKLCSFEKALIPFEKLIESGKLRSVASLRLAYIAWFNSKDFTTISLYPTWVLEGDLYPNASDASFSGDAESPNFGLIFVNAQTGELISPWNDSPNRSYDAPKLIK